MSDCSGTVAIVTGASRGIGRSTAELFARRGARVAAFARSAEMLAEIAAPFGENMLAVAGDVANADDVERLFATVESRFGASDVLVNNAGTIEVARLEAMTPEQWQRTFDVNVTAVYLACRRALPSMRARGRGAIVNVASISGVVGPEKFPGFAAYCASKGAVISLTEALAVEVKDAGVRVNCVSPGSVDTPMWAAVSGGAPASMTPEEIAETILFLASDRSRPMNGQNLHVYSA
ncbi:MAG TPA: SDR family oxidoreductase [Thermoanaerobaculia bacterium]|jgi:NAD(P)-dependent dehydrogenase (short-subunit alcohol dehydrogenase family)